MLGTRWRGQAPGRARRAPRHAILDSQSVKTAAADEQRGFHGGKQIKGCSRHVAIDSQGTLLAVLVRAANKADGAEAGAVMVQACERHPSLESFTADGSYQRQAEEVARDLPGVELHVTAKPRVARPSRPRLKKGALRPSGCAGASNAPSPGLDPAACSPKSTRRLSRVPRRGSGALWCAMMRRLVRRLAV